MAPFAGAARRVAHAVAILCIALGSGRVDATPRVDDDRAAAATRGRAVFESRCYYCHGYAGDAATTAAAYLRPRPRDFTRLDPRAIDRAAMRRSIVHGRPGTAMPAFASVLAPADIDAVIEYVAGELAAGGSPRIRYHEPAAGWGEAFPTRGDTPGGAPARRAAICLTCHESFTVAKDGERSTFDVVTAASPYAVHDSAPVLPDSATPRVRMGERLFQANCAFCHARDGSGRNWIGNFLEPHARDLRSARVCNDATLARLPAIVADGLPDTSMPGWRTVLAPGEIDAVSAYVGAAFCGNPLRR